MNPSPRNRGSWRVPPALTRGGRDFGQSLVEFALILPVMLALLGGSIDFARVFRGWIDLQSATRSASEYVATRDTTLSAAQTDAQVMVCAQVTGNSSCVSPAVTVSNWSLSTTVTGASPAHPIGTATVTATMPFRTLFAYPFFTQNGAWTIGASVTYSVVQGR